MQQADRLLYISGISVVYAGSMGNGKRERGRKVKRDRKVRENRS